MATAFSTMISWPAISAANATALWTINDSTKKQTPGGITSVSEEKAVGCLGQCLRSCSYQGYLSDFPGGKIDFSVEEPFVGPSRNHRAHVY